MIYCNVEVGIRFAGIPMGHEFTSLVLALLQVGGHPLKLEAEKIAQVAALWVSHFTSRRLCLPKKFADHK